MAENRRTLSADELDELLERARREKWTELALVREPFVWHGPRPWHTTKSLGQSELAKIASLRSLVSLELIGPSIGAGVRTLAELTSLTSLFIGWARIGYEGARAVSELPSLTSLNLRCNAIREGRSESVWLDQMGWIDRSVVLRGLDRDSSVTGFRGFEDSRPPVLIARRKWPSLLDRSRNGAHHFMKPRAWWNRSASPPA